MHVSGADVAKPCIAFAHFSFDEALVDNIVKHGYSEPTAIQKQVYNILACETMLSFCAYANTVLLH